MNILFLNYTYPFANNGGTERSIHNISSFLFLRGYNIYVGFFEGKTGNFDHIIKYVDLSNKKKSHIILAEFLIENRIDLIINFKKILNHQVIKAISKSNCKLISSLRYAPNDLEEKLKTIFLDNNLNKTTKLSLKQLIEPLYLLYSKKTLQKQLMNLYNASDKFVLQSDKYIESFSRFIKKDVKNKVETIPNMLSFESSISDNEIAKKEKIVLIVARMEEKSKRIINALNIWNHFQNKFGIKDWELFIIGDGSDLNRYKLYVINNKISNVTFLGRQDPYLFYKRAQVFLMTSSAEGFPTTLIEAQQLGCVPIVFNSFASLQDIITDGENGFSVANNDHEAFIKKLHILTTNNELRLQFARNAVKASTRFEVETIGNKWITVINKTINYNTKN